MPLASPRTWVAHVTSGLAEPPLVAPRHVGWFIYILVVSHGIYTHPPLTSVLGRSLYWFLVIPRKTSAVPAVLVLRALWRGTRLQGRVTVTHREWRRAYARAPVMGKPWHDVTCQVAQLISSVLASGHVLPFPRHPRISFERPVRGCTRSSNVRHLCCLRKRGNDT